MLPRLSRARLAAFSAAAAFCLAGSPPAQEVGGGTLDLDRLFSGEFGASGFGPSWWLEDGGLATLERAAEGPGRDLVRFDPETGERRVVVAAKQLIPEGGKRPLQIAGYEFSPDGSKVLIFTNTRRVWRYHTRGDYWVLDRSSGQLRQLGAGFEEAQLQFAKFDPSGERVAYLYRKDIYVEQLADSQISRLTEGGSDLVTNGTFDWVYEEEWGLRDGFRWSPDGAHIAFWQLDAREVGEFSLIDNSDGLYSKVFRYRYPKVGTTNPSCRIGVVPSQGGDVRWMKLAGDLRDNYVARMEWAASSSELVLQRFNRLQNRNDVTLADIATGETRVVFRDEGEAWVEECDDLRWFDDGARFSFVSERDGWRHMYVVSRDGRDVQPLTRGDYDVISIEHIEEGGGSVYFMASPTDATQRFLYRTSQGGEPERLTPQTRGVHSYDIAPNGRFALHRWSALGMPQVVELVSLPDHRVLRTLEDNERLRRRLETLDGTAGEFFRVEASPGVELDGWIIRPPNFDPAKSYPLLVHVYGEPAAQTVLDRWGGFNYLWHRMLAQRGYVVISMDNRGTPAPRGAAWRKSVYGKIGVIAPVDQANALRALQEKWSWIDRERVGVWGWSGGGSMSLNAIFRYPKLYKAAMAIAFVANQRYYDTIYQERYMGLPSTNPEGFRDGSPITWAHRLEGDLLLIYGTGDDNCHYQNCEALVDELVRHGKQFDMQIYPNRTHSISEGAGTRRHLYSTMTRYLTEHVRPGAEDSSTEGAPAAPTTPLVQPGMTVLFQGDSITDAGRNRKEQAANDHRALGRGYASLAAASLLNECAPQGVQIYNRGISGHKVFQLADRWDADCLELKPDVVSILIGVNDIWHKRNGRYDGTVEIYERDYDALLTRTRKALPDAKLVVCEPFVLRCGAIDDSWFPEFDGYRAAARRVAEKHGAVFVPFQAMFDDALEHGPPESWARDGVHPTRAGAALMAKTWLEYVQGR